MAKDDDKYPAPAAPSKNEQTVDQWFNERINNSVVARNTEIYNFLHAELVELKKRLG